MERGLMKMGMSSGEDKLDKANKRAAERSIQDMQEKRRRMIARHAPLAVIAALDKRIQAAERILKGEEK